LAVGAFSSAEAHLRIARRSVRTMCLPVARSGYPKAGWL
jgi:hypothetical protein